MVQIRKADQVRVPDSFSPPAALSRRPNFPNFPSEFTLDFHTGNLCRTARAKWQGLYFDKSGRRPSKTVLEVDLRWSRAVSCWFFWVSRGIGGGKVCLKFAAFQSSITARVAKEKMVSPFPGLVAETTK